MTRHLLMILTALTLSLSVSAQQNGGAKKADADKKPRLWLVGGDEVWFKPFDMSNPVQKASVKFVNKGNAKLVITDVKVSCECTQVDYPKGFIAPGDTASLAITYAANHPGEFFKSITVMTNGVPPVTRIDLRGTVNEAPEK